MKFNILLSLIVGYYSAEIFREKVNTGINIFFFRDHIITQVDISFNGHGDLPVTEICGKNKVERTAFFLLGHRSGRVRRR